MNKVVSIISICFIIFPCLPVRSGFIGRYNSAVKNRYYGRHHEPYNSGYSYHGRKVSPWESDSTGRQDEDEFWDEHEQDMKSKYRNRVQGSRGCVGLCLYNKMHGIKEDISSSEPKKTEVKGLSRSKISDKTTQKPCVGLCQYYRSMGIPDPFAK